MHSLNTIKVADLSQVVTGPRAAMYLADQGADVIKVEPLTGDSTRFNDAVLLLQAPRLLMTENDALSISTGSPTKLSAEFEK
jgi:crotonobetainyl-CoA:carnitine CoA-transferase CaiB-like acyl-CoA transferase